MATSSVLPAPPSHFLLPSHSPFTRRDWADLRPDIAVAQPQSNASMPGRPRLSLNTSCARSQLGNGSGLRLDALSAVSPTVRNTFRNGLDELHSAAPVVNISYNSSPISGPLRSPHRDSPSPSHERTHSSTSRRATPPSRRSGLSASSPREASPIHPSRDIAQPMALAYLQPANLRSILSNSPHLKRTLLPRSPRTPVSPALQAATPITPVQKRVCFRTPLAEEITNSTYVMRHSDLPSRTPSPPTPEVDRPQLDLVGSAYEYDGRHGPPNAETIDNQTFSILQAATESRPSSWLEERVDDEDDDRSHDSASIVPTPVAGRSKRERQWEWTLGPLNASEGNIIDQSPRSELVPRSPFNLSTASASNEVSARPMPLRSPTLTGT